MELTRLSFTTRVLGALAAFRLEKEEVTQTVRSANEPLIKSYHGGLIECDDDFHIVLDRRMIGMATFHSIEGVRWPDLQNEDARRGGFDDIDELKKALLRAGFRFKPIGAYELYRIHFQWIS